MEDNPTKELIEIYGIRAEEIAYRLGASIHSVYNWKAGKTKPLPFFERKLQSMLRAKFANEKRRHTDGNINH